MWRVVFCGRIAYRCGMKKAKRASRPDLEGRIDQAESLLIQGLSDRQAHKVLKDRYEVSTRTAQRYVSAVYKRWQAAAKELDGRTIDERRVEHERMIRLALANAIKDKRIDLQLRAIESLIKLHGTGSARVELTGKDGGPVTYQDLTDLELRRLVSDAGLERPDVIH